MLYKKKGGRNSQNHEIFSSHWHIAGKLHAGMQTILRREETLILLNCKIHGRDNDINRCLRSH